MTQQQGLVGCLRKSITKRWSIAVENASVKLWSGTFIKFYQTSNGYFKSKKSRLDANFELTLSQCLTLHILHVPYWDLCHCWPWRSSWFFRRQRQQWSHLGKEMRSSDEILFDWNSFSFLFDCSARHCMDHRTAKVRATRQCWQITVKQLSAIGQTRWHVMSFCITMCDIAFCTSRNQYQSHTW